MWRKIQRRTCLSGAPTSSGEKYFAWMRDPLVESNTNTALTVIEDIVVLIFVCCCCCCRDHHGKQKSTQRILRRTMVLHRRFLHTTPAALRKVSFVVRISNQPGSLENVLRVLRNVNLTRIESRPTQQQTSWDVFLDAHVGGVGFISERDLPISDLANVCLSVDLLGRKDVPWFPRQRADLDAFTHKTLDAGSELGCDHPGFTDQVYRDRRAKVVSNAKQFRGINGKLPNVDYSVEETNTWTMVYTELKKRFPKFACQEFLQVFQDLEQCGLYTPKRIPQLLSLIHI